MLTLVLLPGMDGTGLLFEPFIQLAINKFAIKVIDYPVNKPLNYPELESLVKAALPTQGRYIMIGESFSGPIAVAISANRPPRLAGIVLCCTFICNPLPKLGFLRHFIVFLPIIIPPPVILKYLLLSKTTTRKLQSALTNTLTKVTMPTLRARCKAVLECDVPSSYHKFRSLSFTYKPKTTDLYLQAQVY